MERAKSHRVLFAGVVWGLAQAAMLRLLVPPISQAILGVQNNAEVHLPPSFLQAPIAAFFWSSPILAVLIGFWLEDLRQSLKAAVLSSVVSFLAGPFVAIDYVSSSDYFLRLFAFGVVLALFFIGIIGSLTGAILSDWIQPVRAHLLGWPALGFGLLFDGIALSLSIWPRSVTYSGIPTAIPLLLADFTLPLMGILALAGVTCFVIGVRRRNPVGTDRIVLLVLTAAYLIGFSLISIPAASSLSTFGTGLFQITDPVYDNRFFGAIELLSLTILILSLATLLVSISSRQIEGISDKLSRSE